MGITRTFSRCYTTYFSLGENQDIAWSYVVKPIEGIEATADRVAFGGGERAHDVVNPEWQCREMPQARDVWICGLKVINIPNKHRLGRVWQAAVAGKSASTFIQS